MAKHAQLVLGELGLAEEGADEILSNLAGRPGDQDTPRVAHVDCSLIHPAADANSRVPWARWFFRFEGWAKTAVVLDDDLLLNPWIRPARLTDVDALASLNAEVQALHFA